MKPLSESSPVSVGLLVIFIITAGYVYRVSFQTDANAKGLDEMRSKHTALEKIATDIEVIKVKVENIEKALAK